MVKNGAFYWYGFADFYLEIKIRAMSLSKQYQVKKRFNSQDVFIKNGSKNINNYIELVFYDFEPVLSYQIRYYYSYLKRLL